MFALLMLSHTPHKTDSKSHISSNWQLNCTIWDERLELTSLKQLFTAERFHYK